MRRARCSSQYHRELFSERLPSSFSVNEKHVKTRNRASLHHRSYWYCPLTMTKSLSDFESISQI